MRGGRDGRRFQAQHPQATRCCHGTARLGTRHSRRRGFPRRAAFTPTHPARLPSTPLAPTQKKWGAPAPRPINNPENALRSTRGRQTLRAGTWSRGTEPCASIRAARAKLEAPAGANPSARARLGPPVLLVSTPCPQPSPATLRLSTGGQLLDETSCPSCSGSRAERFHPHPELQNPSMVGLEGSSVGHPAQPPAEAGSPRAGCTAPRPGGS